MSHKDILKTTILAVAICVGLAVDTGREQSFHATVLSSVQHLVGRDA